MIASNDNSGSATVLDRQAVRILRRRSAVDLALGETLLALFAGDRLLRLGYAKSTDYAREALGLPARTMRQFTRLAKGLENRPVLRHAVAGGHVSMRKALVVMDVAGGEHETGWAVAAASMTEMELRRRIVDGGGAPPEGAFDVESVIIPMTPEQQDRLEDGIHVARFVLGEMVDKWIATEVIAMEWMGGHPEWVMDESSVPAPMGGTRPDVSPPAHAAAGFEPTPAERLPADPRELHEQARSLMEIRQSFDLEFGPVLRKLRRNRAWDDLGYGSWEEYVRDRLGLSPSSVRQRIWLERRMDLLPEVREALGSGLLTYTKALFVVKDATPENVAGRIAEAASTTLQQVERESDEREDRRNRAAGVRRLWGPKEAFEVVSSAMTACQEMVRAKGEEIASGEALARMADHFVITWAPLVEKYKKSQSKGRLEVLGRHGGFCAVPGCTRTAVHDHHIEFRSRGGSHELSNRSGQCAAHHHRSIHGGFMRVSGRAVERLEWEFGSGEKFVTIGEDDIERVT